MRKKPKIPRAVTTNIDAKMGRELRVINESLDIKPAAVARRGLRRVIPELLKEAGK